jgi:DNA-binding MarR family transcriptional regulator
MTNENKKLLNNVNNSPGTECAGLTWKQRVPLFDNPTGSTCGTQGATSDVNQIDRNISREAEDMLIKVKQEPLTISELYKDQDLSGYKGNKTKQELIRAGLVEEISLPTNKRGRKKKLLQITPKGTEYLRSLGINQTGKGRGGAKHLYYQRMLCEYYEGLGNTVEIEATVGETCLDVLVIQEDGSRLGIEIALSEQYERINAEKALKTGIEHLLFVCESETMLEQLSRMVSTLPQKQFRTKYGVKLVNDFVQST